MIDGSVFDERRYSNRDRASPGLLYDSCLISYVMLPEKEF